MNLNNFLYYKATFQKSPIFVTRWINNYLMCWIYVSSISQYMDFTTYETHTRWNLRGMSNFDFWFNMGTYCIILINCKFESFSLLDVCIQEKWLTICRITLRSRYRAGVNFDKICVFYGKCCIRSNKCVSMVKKTKVWIRVIFVIFVRNLILL